MLLFCAAALSTATAFGQTQVFVHGESGVPCIRIPAITQTTNNTLLAFAECRHWTGDGCVPSNTKPIESGPTYVCMKRSTDNGQTWSTELTYPVGTKISSIQPTVVFDTFTANTILNVLANDTIWQVTSSDNGDTWSKPVDIGVYIGHEYKNSDVGPGIMSIHTFPCVVDACDPVTKQDEACNWNTAQTKKAKM